MFSVAPPTVQEDNSSMSQRSVKKDYYIIIEK